MPLADAVAPSPGFATNRTVFACANDGMYRSTDGGDVWRQVLVGGRTLCAASPCRDAYANMTVLAGTETDGVLRSEDGGHSWSGANAGLLDLMVLAVAVSPHFEQDQIAFCGTPSGLYRTRNSARSWRAVETGLDEPAIQCLAVSPAFHEDRLVLAGTEANGLLRSDDAGATWQRVSSTAAGSVTAVAFSSRYPSMRTVAVATEYGVVVSHDGGRTWGTTVLLPDAVLCLAFVPDGNSEALVAGQHRAGIARSADDGATWQAANSGLNADLLIRLVLSPDFPRDQTLFVCGPDDGVSVSTDAGQTWRACSTGLEDVTVLSLAVSPTYAADRTVYAASPAGLYISRDAGATWQQASGSSVPVRAIATTNPCIVVVGLADGTLLASDDRAASWRTLGGALQGKDVISLALSPDFWRDRTIFAATAFVANAEGSRDLVLWRSTDGGESWHRWLIEQTGPVDLLPLDLPPGHSVDGLIFAGLGSQVLTPRRHVTEVRSHERRPVWRRVSLDGEPLAVTGLAASPSYRDDRTLYVSTSAGVFTSADGGETFVAWSEGLVPNRIVGVAVSPDYAHDRLVYALGLGGLVWRRRA